MINNFLQWVVIAVIFAVAAINKEDISKLVSSVREVDDKVNRLRKNLRKLGD